MKSIFENELMLGMQKELVKQASGDAPDLSKAGECLHAALEIFEQQGMTAQADQVMSVLVKIAASSKQRPVEHLPSITQVMQVGSKFGLSERDLAEFAKGHPVARAKLNLTLRHMGMSDHQIGRFIGVQNVMSEADAKAVADPSRRYGDFMKWMKDPNLPTNPDESPKPGETIEFESVAQKKSRDKAIPKNEHQAEKYMKQYGVPLKMDAQDADVSQPKGWEQEYQKWLEMTGKALPKKEPGQKRKITKDDIDPDLVGLIDVDSFDIDASDDELMGMEIKEDSLEVFEKTGPAEDWED